MFGSFLSTHSQVNGHRFLCGEDQGNHFYVHLTGVLEGVGEFPPSADLLSSLVNGFHIFFKENSARDSDFYQRIPFRILMILDLL